MLLGGCGSCAVQMYFGSTCAYQLWGPIERRLADPLKCLGVLIYSDQRGFSLKTPGLKLWLVGAEMRNCANCYTANRGFAL